MADYRYLTDEDKARIVAEVKAQIPTVEQIEREREAAHFRATIEAAAGLRPAAPDDLEPVDMRKEDAVHDALDAIAVTLPALVVDVQAEP